MTLEALSRRKVPLGVGLLLLAGWLCSGLRRVSDESGAAVLDSPLGLVAPRQVAPGWTIAPPGLLRIAFYPVRSTTFDFAVGSSSSPLTSREGTDLTATGTIRYKVDQDRLMEVHRLLGPSYEAKSIRPWIAEGLRAIVGNASYGDVSGARTEDLRETLARGLGDRFRAAGLVLLSCDVTGMTIRSGPE
ncbi:MAG TPA: SPFH domain-containing protein, partial [Candidatus Polarisedimenticolia bacterium]